MFLVAALFACGAKTGLPGKVDNHDGPRVVTSNILRGDYVGSESCRACHPSLYADWLASPMRQMTRMATAAVPRAPFDGRGWKFKDDEARFEKLDGAYVMSVRSAASGEHRYRITRIIGGRTREDFAGIELGPRDTSQRMDEYILPVSYFFETASFRPKGYSVMVSERPGLVAGAVWNHTCVLCHNTAPLFPSLWGALYGKGAPAFQGETVDGSLPPDRRWRLDVLDPGALRAAIKDEMRFLGDADNLPLNTHAALAGGIRSMKARFEGGHLLEVGIGCEACHGGCREHAQKPRVATAYEPRSPFLRVRSNDAGDAPTRAEAINHACARCHKVLFSRYPYTWEGERRRGSTPGGSTTNSGEARDMLLGGCAKSLSCADCHDPHRDDDPADMAALTTKAGNTTCTRCHPAYASDNALRGHSHHDPDRAGGSCIACHMPRKNLGLTYTLGRYHRIGSPTDPTRVEKDRPLECALCHADKTVGNLVSTMERWWNKRYDRAALLGLYKNLGALPLQTTVALGKPHEQAVAIISLREQGVASALPLVAKRIAHAIPLVRYQVRKAIDAFLDKPCGIDLDLPTPAIIAATLACVPAAAPIPAPPPMRREAPRAPHDND